MRSTLLVFLLVSLPFLRPLACIQPTVSHTERVDSILLQYNELINTNPTKALTLGKTALKESQIKKYKKGELQAQYSLGKAYYLTLQMDSATYHLNKGIELGAYLHDTLYLILCKKWIGSVLRYQSDHEGALHQYQQALDLSNRVNLVDEIPKLTQNIAALFLDQGHSEKAIYYFKKSLKQITDPYTKSVCNANLGLAYLKNLQFELALLSFEKSLQYCKEVDNPNCEITPLEMITSTYLDQGKFKIALKYGLEVLEKRKIQDSTPHMVNAYNQVGLIYLNLQEFEHALQYFEYCLSLHDYIQPSMLPLIHANMAMAYDSLEIYEPAVKHLWKFVQAKDTLNSTETQNHINGLLAKFDTERKEQEILLLQKERELKESELNRQMLLRNIATVAVIIALIGLIVFRHIYSQKIEVQKTLAIKQQEINEQKTKELIRENELKATKANIEGQEQERKRIAQELHDGIAGNLATMKIHLSDLSSDVNSDSLKNIIHQMDMTYDQVRSLSHHLMPPSIQRLTLIQLIDSYLNEIKPSMVFSIHFNYHNKAVIDGLDGHTKHELYRITQELMNNIIKHARPKHVDIQLNVNDEELNLMVEDDGVGFDLNAISKGIGLKSIESRVSKVHGHLHMDTKPNYGTTVSIDIPIQTKVLDEV